MFPSNLEVHLTSALSWPAHSTTQMYTFTEDKHIEFYFTLDDRKTLCYAMYECLNVQKLKNIGVGKFKNIFCEKLYLVLSCGLFLAHTTPSFRTLGHLTIQTVCSLGWFLIRTFGLLFRIGCVAWWIRKFRHSQQNYPLLGSFYSL